MCVTLGMSHRITAVQYSGTNHSVMGSEIQYSAANHSVMSSARLTYLSETDREEELGGLVLINQIVQSSVVQSNYVQCSAIKLCTMQ